MYTTRLQRYIFRMKHLSWLRELNCFTTAILTKITIFWIKHCKRNEFLPQTLINKSLYLSNPMSKNLDIKLWILSNLSLKYQRIFEVAKIYKLEKLSLWERLLYLNYTEGLGKQNKFWTSQSTLIVSITSQCLKLRL